MTPVDGAAYGRQFAAFYDQLYPREGSVDAAVRFLAARYTPGVGPPLELGVGTGRIARPLAERLGPVVGVDPSEEMLEALEAAGGGVTAVQGDMRDYRDTSDHGLVYCVLSSLSILLERDEQLAAFKTFATAAAPGAAVVVETKNPAFVDLMHDGRTTDTRLVPYPAPDTALLSHMTLDRARGIWHVAHVFFDRGHTRIASEISRLVAPSDLDVMAAEAGLRFEARYASWAEEPVGDRKPMVVSTYRKPTAEPPA